MSPTGVRPLPLPPSRQRRLWATWLASSGIVSVALADGSAVKAVKTSADATKGILRRASRRPPLHPERRLHPGDPARGSRCPHRRTVTTQSAARAAAPGRQRRTAQPLPLEDQGMLRGRRRLRRREFGARLHPHRITVLRDARRHRHRCSDQGLCRRRGRQGRHARTPGIEAGPVAGERAARRCGQRHRSGLPAKLDHDVRLAARCDQHRGARQAIRGRLRHRRRQGTRPARPVLHQPRREGFPGDRDRRRTHGRCSDHAGHLIAGPARCRIPG
jgi:hypothetical protein